MIVKFSTSYKQKRQRFVDSAQYFLEIGIELSKKDAIRMIKNFKEGIEKNNFRLTPLTDASKKLKANWGAAYPNRPLYGVTNSNSPNSFKNMLRMRRVKNGYKVYPSWAKHENSDISLRDLLRIHEFGKIIVVTDKMRGFLSANGMHLKATTKFIRIPPRNAFQKAVNRTLAQKREVSGPKMRAAISAFIRDNNKDYLRQLKVEGAKDMTRIMEALLQ